VDLDDVELLASDQGRHLVGQLATQMPRYDAGLALRLIEGLRARGVEAKLAAAALTQVRLRERARAKFGQFADQMLFTDQGLQQATRLDVAAHHAQRFLAAGARQVADLTGGIGGDALAMAALGLRVTVFERDPVTAAIARANLAAFPEAQVIQADSLEADLASQDALWADPSRRRQGGRRVFDPEAWEPPLGALAALARGRPAGIKVAPGIAHRAIPEGAEAQWTSQDGEVVEAALWFGPLRSAPTPSGPPQGAPTPPPGAAPPGGPTGSAATSSGPPPGAAPGNAPPACAPARSALVIRQGRAHHLLRDAAPRLPAGRIGQHIYEPDGAVIRASLLQQAAAPLAEPRLVHPRIAYITSDTRLGQNPFLTGYSVEETFPFSLARLRAWARANGIGQLVVKKRGTAVDPADLLKRLDLKGEAAAWVILTRLGAAQSVLVVKPHLAPGRQ
jgi:hypothetical protein